MCWYGRVARGSWWCHQMETFSAYWPFLRGIHRSSVNSPHKGPWRGALMFSLICAWINGLVNNGEAGDLRYHRAHYDVTVILRVYVFLGESCVHRSVCVFTCKLYRVFMRVVLYSCVLYCILLFLHLWNGSEIISIHVYMYYVHYFLHVLC